MRTRGPGSPNDTQRRHGRLRGRPVKSNPLNLRFQRSTNVPQHRFDVAPVHVAAGRIVEDRADHICVAVTHRYTQVTRHHSSTVCSRLTCLSPDVIRRTPRLRSFAVSRVAALLFSAAARTGQRTGRYHWIIRNRDRGWPVSGDRLLAAEPLRSLNESSRRPRVDVSA